MVDGPPVYPPTVRGPANLSLEGQTGARGLRVRGVVMATEDSVVGMVEVTVRTAVGLFLSVCNRGVPRYGSRVTGACGM